MKLLVESEVGLDAALHGVGEVGTSEDLQEHECHDH